MKKYVVIATVGIEIFGDNVEDAAEVAANRLESTDGVSYVNVKGFSVLHGRQGVDDTPEL